MTAVGIDLGARPDPRISAVDRCSTIRHLEQRDVPLLGPREAEGRRIVVPEMEATPRSRLEESQVSLEAVFQFDANSVGISIDVADAP